MEYPYQKAAFKLQLNENFVNFNERCRTSMGVLFRRTLNYSLIFPLFLLLFGKFNVSIMLLNHVLIKKLYVPLRDSV